jgi:hypothetical protein
LPETSQRIVPELLDVLESQIVVSIYVPTLLTINCAVEVKPEVSVQSNLKFFVAVL